MFFIGAHSYLSSPEKWAAEGRWEVTNESCSKLGYEIPSQEFISRHKYFHLSEKIFHELLAEEHGNPTMVFKRMLCERIETLEDSFNLALNQAEGVEVILTLCNCPSLSAVAQSRGIPLIHIELGPLRPPLYHATAYMDFQGVNGNTEAEARYKASTWRPELNISLSTLQSIFRYKQRGCLNKRDENRFRAGVVLQVEDDSNLVAFGNGYSNQDLLTYASLEYGAGNIVVRPHPGSVFKIKEGCFELDASPNSLAFIGQCEKILTINSSVGLEAILQGIPVTVLGDCSYAFINNAENNEERLRRIAYYLLCYLVPMNMITDAEYLRFRIANQNDKDIFIKHLIEYMEEKSLALARVEEEMSALNAEGIKGKGEDIDLDQFSIERDQGAAQVDALQAKVDEMQGWLVDHDREIVRLQCAFLTEQDQRAIADAQVDELQIKANELQIQLTERNNEIARLQNALRVEQQQISEIYRSRSWRVTAGLRVLGTGARHAGGKKVMQLLRRTRNVARYMLRGDIAGLLQRVKQIRRDKQQAQRMHSMLSSGLELRIGIMATPHTLFIGHLIADALKRVGISSAIVGEPQSFDLDCYIVICPQMFQRLPPGHQRIAFQMEQGISSRWFTPEYVDMLENSLAILDYASANLQFLSDKGLSYPHIFLVPVGGLKHYPEFLRQQEPEMDADSSAMIHDVLFYGDVNAPRRQTMLQALHQHFKVRVEGNLFGQELHKAMRSAHVVVNIHYYEGALLETTRIYECLSLGVPVVSESSSDMQDHQELVASGAVSFTPVGDAEAMVQAVALKLEEIRSGSSAIAQSIDAAVTASGEYFAFMLYRMLYSLKLLSHSQWQQGTADCHLPGPRLVLGMPETWKRRSHFLQTTASRLGDAQLFDGVRYTPGWRGCAMSYQYMARKALQAGWNQLEVSEDDVTLDDSYPARRDIVTQWLEEHAGQWDVFSGLMAKVHPETRVLAVHDYQGLTFVVLDRMISTVHNIYAATALQVMTQWDPNNEDPTTNTIDVYLQSHSALRVVVALPFLVGHAEEMHSSLWGFNNGQYTEMIAQTQSELQDLVQEFRRRTASQSTVMGE